MFEFLKKLIAKETGNELLRFNDTGIILLTDDIPTVTVPWDELNGISVVTTDQGPLVDDIFWLLHTNEACRVIPSETDGMESLLERLQQLRGFDNEAIIQAMSCTDNNHFIIWKRDNSANQNE